MTISGTHTSIHRYKHTFEYIHQSIHPSVHTEYIIRTYIHSYKCNHNEYKYSDLTTTAGLKLRKTQINYLYLFNLFIYSCVLCGFLSKNHCLVFLFGQIHEVLDAPWCPGQWRSCPKHWNDRPMARSQRPQGPNLRLFRPWPEPL